MQAESKSDENLWKRLKHTERELNELKVAKTKLDMEKYDLQLKLRKSEKKINADQKQYEKDKELLLLQARTNKQNSVEYWVGGQTREDAIREKEMFTAVKKQLWKQLQEEKDRSGELERQLHSLKNTLRKKSSEDDEKLKEDQAEGSSINIQSLYEARAPVESAFQNGYMDQKEIDNALQDKIRELERRLAELSSSRLTPTQADELQTSIKEARFVKEKTEAMLLSAQENVKALKNQITLNIEDMETLKAQLSSTSMQVRETELEYKRKLEDINETKRTELARKDKEIEATMERCKAELATLNDNHAKSHESQVNIIGKLWDDLESHKSNFAKRGIEYEKMSVEISNYREKVTKKSEKITALEQRNKRLEREKRALIAEVKRLQGNDNRFTAELTAEREARGQWETKCKHLQEDHLRLVEEQKEFDAERIKYIALYRDADKEKDAALDLLEEKMKEHNTKLKTLLDIGQGLMVTLDNMKLDKLQKSTAGMTDVQRLQWANAQILQTLMPTIRKQMIGKDELDDIAALTKTVLSNLLLTLCENTLFSNNIQLKISEK